MKSLKTFGALLCAAAVLTAWNVARAADDEKKPCCEATVEAGKKCEHKCCTKAADAGKVCKKCHPKKEVAK